MLSRRADWPFFIRASISPTGSLKAMGPVSGLPARLHDAGQHSRRGELTQRQPRQFEFAIDAARAAAQLAAIAYTCRRGVARHLRKLQAGCETILRRQLRILRLLLQRGSLGGVLLHQPGAPLVL